MAAGGAWQAVESPLGSAATLTPEQARRAARDVLARVRLGDDPAKELSKRRETPTFRDFAQRYLDEEGKAKLKPRTLVNYRIYLLNTPRHRVRPQVREGGPF